MHACMHACMHDISRSKKQVWLLDDFGPDCVALIVYQAAYFLFHIKL